MKKICFECKTENEEQFLFCKNCGNPLEEEHQTKEPILNNEPQVEKIYVDPGSNANPQQKQETFFAQPDNISGIDKEEFITFIGKNADKIYSKFIKTEYSGSKVSWCWPAAILQFAFGFLGSAIWFFYRKMYKIAIILVALGIVFTTATTVLTYDMQVSAGKDVLNYFSNFLDEIESGNFEHQSNIIEDIEKAPDNADLIIKSGIAEILGWIENLGGTALVGMFAMYFYKKKCTKKIAKLKNSPVDSRYYSYCLSLIGGTSGGMVALGIIISVLVTMVVNSVVMLPLLSYLGG